MKQDKNTLYNWFTRGVKPLSSQFADWLESYWHKDEYIPIDKVDGLKNALNNTATTGYVDNSIVYEKANREAADHTLQINITEEAAARARADDAKADLVNGKVPAEQLPGYTGDVIERDDIASFPLVGEQGKLYVACDSNKTYRWNGGFYVELAQGLSQVSADWDSQNGLSVILNKPTLALVATSNNYADLDNKPTDSGWITVTPVNNETAAATANFQCRKIGKVVYVRGFINFKNDTTVLEEAIATLPDECCPQGIQYFHCIHNLSISINARGSVISRYMGKEQSGDVRISLSGISFLID